VTSDSSRPLSGLDPRRVESRGSVRFSETVVTLGDMELPSGGGPLGEAQELLDRAMNMVQIEGSNPDLTPLLQDIGDRLAAALATGSSEHQVAGPIASSTANPLAMQGLAHARHLVSQSGTPLSARTLDNVDSLISGSRELLRNLPDVYSSQILSALATNDNLLSSLARELSATTLQCAIRSHLARTAFRQRKTTPQPTTIQWLPPVFTHQQCKQLLQRFMGPQGSVLVAAGIPEQTLRKLALGCCIVAIQSAYRNRVAKREVSELRQIFDTSEPKAEAAVATQETAAPDSELATEHGFAATPVSNLMKQKT